MSTFDSTIAPPPGPLIPSASQLSALQAVRPKITKENIIVDTVEDLTLNAALISVPFDVKERNELILEFI